MTIEERLLQNERQRDRYSARQQNMMTEEQRFAERERSRVSYRNRQENLTNEERLLQNARRRDQYRARKQNSGNHNSSSTESLIPRRSPRFIGCGSTIESLDQGQSRDPQTTIVNNKMGKQIVANSTKIKKEIMTEQRKRAFDKRQRIAYRNLRHELMEPVQV
ncbi:hypothetical protein MKW92_011668, partial [Papaver armeniacum]